MKTRFLAALSLATAPAAFAQDVVRVGVIAEMSGPFAEFGKQMQAGIQAYQKMHGDSVAGKRVEVVIKDVGGPNPDAAKRIATELVVREKVNVLAGFGFTPNALAVAPIATQAKLPMIVLNPAEPPLLMRNTVYCLVDGGCDHDGVAASIEAMVASVQEYVPGYRLKQEVQFERFGSNNPVSIPGVGIFEGLKTSVFLEVEGAAHYLPAYAGNLDIMTSAGLRTAEKIAARRMAHQPA